MSLKNMIVVSYHPSCKEGYSFIELLKTKYEITGAGGGGKWWRDNEFDTDSAEARDAAIVDIRKMIYEQKLSEFIRVRTFAQKKDMV